MAHAVDVAGSDLDQLPAIQGGADLGGAEPGPERPHREPGPPLDNQRVARHLGPDHTVGHHLPSLVAEDGIVQLEMVEGPGALAGQVEVTADRQVRPLEVQLEDPRSVHVTDPPHLMAAAENGGTFPGADIGVGVDGDGLRAGPVAVGVPPGGRTCERPVAEAAIVPPVHQLEQGGGEDADIGGAAFIPGHLGVVVVGQGRLVEAKIITQHLELLRQP